MVRTGGEEAVKDQFNREIDYMRVSITDRCNLRCRYCMPGGAVWMKKEELLTLEEIVLICEEAAKLGIRKIKLTGGEPLIRVGCADLVGQIKGISGIEQVTLTTNGILLPEMAEKLVDQGLDGINISVDSLDEERYCRVTGASKSTFLQLQKALSLVCRDDFPISVKINTVLQEETWEKEWIPLVEFARNHTVDVRFIELMPIGCGRELPPVPNEILRKKIAEKYGRAELVRESRGNGPAVYEHFPGFQGYVGYISAVHERFCSSCNRIRMTSDGEIKPCLCYGETFSVRELARQGDRDGVRKQLQKAIIKKPAQHHFEKPEEITESHVMAKIGG